MLAGEEVERVGDDHVAIPVVVLEITANGPGPVEVGQAADGAVPRAVEGAAHGLLDPAAQPSHDLVHHRPHNLPRRLLGPFGNHALECHERADQLDAGRHLAERFRLEEELLETLFLDGVALDDGDDVLGEIAADIAEPLGQAQRGTTQTGAALLGVPPSASPP